MRWFMRLFQKSQPEEPPQTARTPEITEAIRSYQSEKLKAFEQRAELEARLKRLGYDLEHVTRRDRDDPSYQ